MFAQEYWSECPIAIAQSENASFKEFALLGRTQVIQNNSKKT